MLSLGLRDWVRECFRVLGLGSESDRFRVMGLGLGLLNSHWLCREFRVRVRVTERIVFFSLISRLVLVWVF